MEVDIDPQTGNFPATYDIFGEPAPGRIDAAVTLRAAFALHQDIGGGRGVPVDPREQNTEAARGAVGRRRGPLGGSRELLRDLRALQAGRFDRLRRIVQLCRGEARHEHVRRRARALG